MVSNRIKSDARTHMAKNPGTSYQEALRAVATSPKPEGVDMSAAHAEIDAIIGQDDIKSQLRTFAGAGAPKPPNFLFTGGPGTGKTSTAHILAHTLHAAGAVTDPAVVSVGRSQLVGVYEGETSRKTAAVFDSARSRVLLVDDAHNLVQDRGGPSDPFGYEALGTLAEKMRDGSGEVVVVFAGYGEPLRRILDQNLRYAGMFGRIIEFTSPTPNDMWLILNAAAADSQLIIDPDAQGRFTQIIEYLRDVDHHGHCGLDVVGNARFARNIINEAQRMQAARLSTTDYAELTDAQLMELTNEDVTNAAETFIRATGLDILEL